MTLSCVTGACLLVLVAVPVAASDDAGCPNVPGIYGVSPILPGCRNGGSGALPFTPPPRPNLDPKINSQNVLDAPWPGDLPIGELRSQGYVFIDRLTRDSIRELGEGRYELRVRQESGNAVTNVVILSDRALASVSASAALTNSGDVRYVYALVNRADSTQNILDISVSLPDDHCLSGFTNGDGWSMLNLGGRPPRLVRNEAAWLPLGGTPLLPPGHEVHGLTLTSPYLPGITHAVIRSVPPRGIEQDFTGELSDHLSEYLGELHHRLATPPIPTIGPMIPPPGADLDGRGRVVAYLIGDVDLAKEVGFVDANGENAVRDVLDRARDGIASSEALGALASAVVDIPGGERGYLSGLQVALRVLAASAPAERGAGSR